MVSAQHIYKAFGERVVLRDVTFELLRGEMVGVVGPSGGGKSVLLKLLGQVIEPDGGELRFSELGGSVPRVGFLFQEGALFDSQTVLENVAFPLIAEHEKAGTLTRENQQQCYQRAAAALDAVGLFAAVNKYPGQLSGGMRRRAGIARAIVAEPDLVLLDDPTGGLDPVAATVIMNLIGKLRTRNLPTVVVVSHDIRRLLPNVDRIIGLFAGEIVCDMSVNDLLTKAPADVLAFLKTRFDFEQFQPATA